MAVLLSELLESAPAPSALPPLAGRFVVEGEAIRFIPRFPFLEGRRYSLRVTHWGAGEASEPDLWTIERPARAEAPTTDVVAVYPSAEELPVNQLKLYVHFSGPMSEGWAARSVRVHRLDNGEALEGVFLSMEPELWDRERRRLTLLLDPGRIKRGLVPNEEAGYPLIESVQIAVVIVAAFRDAGGRPLRSSFERRYRVGPPLRERVDPSGWRYQWPAAESTEPLIVNFDRPLDHALLEHCLWISGRAGVPLPGNGLTGPRERSWRFEPETAWKAAHYMLVVDPRLEDLAGNSLIRVFDRDLRRTEDTPVDARHVAIDFTCLPAQPESHRMPNRR